jgi:hypothetical protein
MKKMNQDIKDDEVPPKYSKIDVIDSSSIAETSTSLSSVSEIHNLKTLLKEIEKLLKSGDNLDDPILVGKVSSVDVWNEYLEYEQPPLRPKFCFFSRDTLEVFIVEFPITFLHETFVVEIFAQLRDQSTFVSSGGSATVSFNQADQFITPRIYTPGFSGIPANTSWTNYSTLLVEVGLSQGYGGNAGLDRKSRMWFDSLHMHGLQYILCN